MSQPDETGGLPTKAVHESYLRMQQSLTEYRRANDRGSEGDRARAHGNVQGAVLEFYEMLRPYLKRRNLRHDYWNGTIPSYRQDGTPPTPDDGVAVLEVQRKADPFDITGLQLQEEYSAKELHQALPLSRDVRVVGSMVEKDTILVAYHTYVTGLQHLDNWQTTFAETSEDVGGFLSGQRESTTTRQRVGIQKLTRAARELSDAADELGLLARVDESRQRNRIDSTSP